MDNQFILCIGEKRFMMSLDEAMQIAMTLNSCQRVEPTYIRNVGSDVNRTVKMPDIAAAFVVPMTALLLMEMETNAKTIEANK